MKYLIFSDLHGSAIVLEKLLQHFNYLNCDQLISLGDVLYHGPRNDIPNFYNPKKVVELLNSYKDKIFGITGNCDAEVDEMVLDFPFYREYDCKLNGLDFHLEHGHHLAEKKIDSTNVLYGHTHVPQITKCEGVWYLNPGSPTIPKNGSMPSFFILDGYDLYLYNLDGIVLQHQKLRED